MRIYVESIAEGVHVLRVDDDRVNFFEGLWEIPEGISYNSYVIETSEGVVVIDGWKYNYAAAFVELVESIVDPARIRYIVVQHMEPDHTGSLESLAKRAVNARVLAHPLALRMAKQSYPTLASRMQPVRDGQVLRVGGYTLQFIYTPWLHWPETIVTLLRERGILFTCDVFGGYGTLPYIFDDEAERAGRLEEALWLAQKYVVTVIGHYRDYIVKALDKLSALGVKPSVVAPGHGLVWRSHVSAILGLYSRLGRGEARRGKALVIAVTMYGSSDMLAGIAARLLAARGYSVYYYTLNDVKRALLSDIVSHAADSEVIVIGGATYEAETNPLLGHVASLLCEKAGIRGRRIVILSPYGWGGVAAKKLKEMLTKCGFSVETFELHMAAPPSTTVELLRELTKRIEETLAGGEAR